METKIIQLNKKSIEECIYCIRGLQVMLDCDIAFFFGANVSSLNRQMKRNIERFPVDFCFQLSNKEMRDLRCQNGTTKFLSSKRRYNPYVYTEEGIIALAGVLKNDIAAKMSIEIARKFIQMRKFILENGDAMLTLAKLQNHQIEFENETNKKFDEILKLISKADLPKQVLFYDGQYFDAYDFIVSLIKKAKHSIILMDPYCDNRALSLLSDRNEGVQITIYKANKAKLNDEMVDAFTKQYGEIIVKESETFHDRFLIIDKEECYFLGTSLNYAGKKAFAVNKAEKEIVELLLAKL